MEADSDQEDAVPTVNFIPCVHFVKRGVAKANPDKVTLTPAELARIINGAREDLEEEGGDGMDTSEDEENEDSPQQINVRAADSGNASGDEFRFDNYDQESGEPVMTLGQVAVVDENEQINDDEDSEAEDDIIKPTDNLILVGHVENDTASMEVYVYNEEEDSLYVHHDFLLPSPPLCIEWMSHDPGSETPGNIFAIGTMDPIITLWDLDIQDSLEPICSLGSKGSRKKNKPKVGHKDAVLDLSWNRFLTHILASGSVDQTVILWDLDEGKPHTTIKDFNEKVQTLSFHPTNADSLLAGSCDGIVKVFDCRATDNASSTFKSWNLNGEIERVAWNKFNNNCFMASTNDGRIHYVDIRMDDILWSKTAHEQEVTGLVVSSKVDGMVVTASSDGHLKVWDINQEDGKLIYDRKMKLGVLQCLDECPESPFILSIGGDLKTKNFQVLNLLDNEIIANVFKNRTNDPPPTQEMEDISIDDE